MNPYPGLRPFTPEEAPLFTGRDAIADAAATRLRIAPLTVLFARSGVGKSSFLMCRLLPLLAVDSRVELMNEWGAEPPEVAIDRRLSALQAAASAGAEKPVLVLDQFEDVFKLAGDRDALWDRLAAWVNSDDAPVSVLISMREEWLGAWQEAVEYLPDALASLIRLAPLSDRELARAIQRPAQIDGTVTVTPDVVRLLLADLQRPHAYGLGGARVEAGLLQLVCHRLWEEAAGAPGHTMNVALYERLGRSDQIVREFIWNKLGSTGTTGAAFTSSERVVWVGLTRYLTLGQGAKALVSPRILAQQLQMRDLGLAGPAALAGVVSRRNRTYLGTGPEKRGLPPPELVAVIATVLQKGADAGFVKPQRGALAEDGRLYELAHDTLGAFLQQFALDFEHWVRNRFVTALGVVAVVFVALTVVVNVFKFTGPKDAAGAVLALLVLLGLAWLVRTALSYVSPVMAFPVMRRLAGGRMARQPRPRP